MERSSPNRAYRIVIFGLAFIALVVLTATVAALVASRPPSPEDIAATLTAMPTPTAMLTPTPTPVPTLSGVSDDLLICQREAGQALNVRNIVGAVNISDDHLLLVSWVSTEWAVRDLDDALSGVIMGFDVALDLWQRGCAVYDRVQIDVYDGTGDTQIYRLTVRVSMDDLLKWRARELDDSALTARLEVTQPER